MTTYLAYIGTSSTPAKLPSMALDALPLSQRSESHWQGVSLVGVWEGQSERVMRYPFTAPDDATALRYAYAMAILSGNDAVLISREYRPGEGDNSFQSVRPYIVSTIAAYAGQNRTVATDSLAEAEEAPGWAYTPDVRGDEVAYLAWSDGHVSSVGA